jgi:biotin transporter BioY
MGYLIGYLSVPALVAYFLARLIVLRTNFGSTNQKLKFWIVFMACFIFLALVLASGAKK